MKKQVRSRHEYGWWRAGTENWTFQTLTGVWCRLHLCEIGGQIVITRCGRPLNWVLTTGGYQPAVHDSKFAMSVY